MRSPARLGNILLTVLALGTARGQSASENNDVTTATRVMVRGSEVREFDWAKLQSRAHVAYVSSGPRTQGGRMIDNDLQTVFRFSGSDKSPTVVVELAQNANLHRVVTAFKAEEGVTLDIFLFNELPKDANDLGFANPVASIVDLPDNHGVMTADFAVSSARYVALRWTRKRQEPFEVAEISALSTDPADLIVGEDMKLADNTVPNFAPEPPIVPVVSP